MKKIYIAGKVSGLQCHQVSMKFGTYQKKLMDEGHHPVVPLDLCMPGDDWPTAMKKCIKAMLDCDEVHLLPDWTDSTGARLEALIARNLSMEVVEVAV